MAKKAKENGTSPRGRDKTFQSLADLTPDPANARKHNPRNVGMLVDALHQVGAARSIVVDENGVVLAGNATIEAAAEAGIHRVKTVEADGSEIVAVVRRGLSKEQKTKLALYDNRVAELAEWNPDILSELVDTKVLEGMFSDKELAEILTQTGIEPKDAEPQIDKAEELRQKWGTETGQLWVIGNHRLLCEDWRGTESLNRLLSGLRPRYGMIDPPYGIDVVQGASVGGSKPFGSIGGKGVVKVNKYVPVEGDDEPFDPQQVLGVIPSTILWGANYYADKLPPTKGWIVWDKKAQEGWRDNFSDCELAWTPFGITTRLYQQVWMGMVQEGKREARLHPTQKPAVLYQRIISDLFIDDGITLDLYAGSGPSLIACENLGRSCYAAEMHPPYVAVCLERMTTAFPHLKIEKVDQARAA